MSARRRGALLALPAALLAAAAAVLTGEPPGGAAAYPLDGAARTGIERLRGQQAAHEQGGRGQLAPGALLSTDEVTLHLADANPEWDLAAQPEDPVLEAALESIFAPRDPSYGVAVVDFTDPAHIRWAGVRENLRQNPGSVGKLLCMVALFDALRRAFPDTGERLRVLRETDVEAADWTSGGSHKVPKYDPASGRNEYAPLAAGEHYRLSEWLDHMVSASANPAGSAVWLQAMLLRRFGADYPPAPAQARAFFRDTPKQELFELSQRVIEEPLRAAGIDVDNLRQGSLWTALGKQRIPGTSSFATPRELARLLLRIEQGRMVDRWSSLEMKRYLYLTKRRYRYVYPPELRDAAVYFKSGSLYRCRAEEGFTCAKYHGNVYNYMNSAVIIESPARPPPPQRRYIVALMSNVLRVNSAWDHSRLGAAIEEAVRTRGPTTVKEQGTEEERRDVGRSE